MNIFNFPRLRYKLDVTPLVLYLKKHKYLSGLGAKLQTAIKAHPNKKVTQTNS
jgi:hypothetical protein